MERVLREASRSGESVRDSRTFFSFRERPGARETAMGSRSSTSSSSSSASSSIFLGCEYFCREYLLSGDLSPLATREFDRAK